MFLKISEYSQKNTCVRISFWIKLPQASNFIKKETPTKVFSSEFWETFMNIFSHTTPPVAAFESLEKISSVIRQKGKSQNGGHKKAKHHKFSEKTNTCFAFLLPPFRYSLFCLITDDLSKKISALTHCMPLISFHIPWKHKKTIGFPMSSGVIERDHWHERG